MIVTFYDNLLPCSRSCGPIASTSSSITAAATCYTTVGDPGENEKAEETKPRSNAPNDASGDIDPADSYGFDWLYSQSEHSTSDSNRNGSPFSTTNPIPLELPSILPPIAALPSHLYTARVIYQRYTMMKWIKEKNGQDVSNFRFTHVIPVQKIGKRRRTERRPTSLNESECQRRGSYLVFAERARSYGNLKVAQAWNKARLDIRSPRPGQTQKPILSTSCTKPKVKRDKKLGLTCPPFKIEREVPQKIWLTIRENNQFRFFPLGDATTPTPNNCG
ncbi:hypothetical protein DL93DRAFT_502107 [Clavulina sp. PMI_390]|nr:hypothetical protein DL93DRAFT_502107 [Clavulina sp. PMI_390]